MPKQKDGNTKPNTGKSRPKKITQKQVDKLFVNSADAVLTSFEKEAEDIFRKLWPDKDPVDHKVILRMIDERLLVEFAMYKSKCDKAYYGEVLDDTEKQADTK